MDENLTKKFLFKVHDTFTCKYYDDLDNKEKIDYEDIFIDIDNLNYDESRIFFRNLNAFKEIYDSNSLTYYYKNPSFANSINVEIKLAKKQIECILGTAMGDSFVGSRLEFIQTEIHTDYFFNTQFVLANIVSSSHSSMFIGDANGKLNRFLKFITYQHTFFTDFRNIFYNRNVKVINENFLTKYLSLYALSYWLMDDGSKIQNTVILCTQNFDLSDHYKIKRVFLKNFGINVNIRQAGISKSFDRKYFIYIPTSEFKKISGNLNIVETMKYKLNSDLIENKLIIEENVVRRMKTYETIKKNLKQTVYICKYPGCSSQQFNSYNRLAEHEIAKHKPAYVHCKFCPIVFINEVAKTSHVKRKHNFFYCFLCNSCLIEARKEINMHKEKHIKDDKKIYKFKSININIRKAENSKLIDKISELHYSHLLGFYEYAYYLEI